MFKIIYKFNGKPYRTVNGMVKALSKDCGAVEVGMVKDNQIKCYAADRKTVVAIYNVMPPKLGEDQVVTRSS